MGQLTQFTQSVVEKLLAEGYPHLRFPAVVYATVTGARKLPETYEVKELEITDEDSGRTFKAHFEAHWYEYTLKVLDRFGGQDDAVPVLPGIRSKLPLESGATVAVGLPYGDLNAAIIGEVVL